MTYLLDTNVVSELRRLRPHGAVVAWLSAIPDEHICISAATVGEIQAGIEITREQDAAKAEALSAWLDQVVATYAVVPVDSEIAREWARIKHRKSDTLVDDALIAATARVRKLTVATRNVRDFQDFGVDLFNPFD